PTRLRPVRSRTLVRNRPWPFGWASGAGNSAQPGAVPTAALTCGPGNDNPENPGRRAPHAGQPPSFYPDAAATPTTPELLRPPPRRTRPVPPNDTAPHRHRRSAPT